MDIDCASVVSSSGLGLEHVVGFHAFHCEYCAIEGDLWFTDVTFVAVEY